MPIPVDPRVKATPPGMAHASSTALANAVPFGGTPGTGVDRVSIPERPSFMNTWNVPSDVEAGPSRVVRRGLK